MVSWSNHERGSATRSSFDRLRTSAEVHKQGVSAEAIVDQFPHLDLARIYAALAYYYANMGEIEADLEAGERLGEDLAAKYPLGWTPETNQP